jgi:hypothetical protein
VRRGEKVSLFFDWERGGGGVRFARKKKVFGIAKNTKKAYIHTQRTHIHTHTHTHTYTHKKEILFFSLISIVTVRPSYII